MSNYNTLVVTCVQLITNEVVLSIIFYREPLDNMDVATGAVIGVVSRTPTIQNSWIRPWRWTLATGLLPNSFCYMRRRGLQLDEKWLNFSIICD